MIQQLKEELLASVVKRLEILESDLFDKNKETQDLKAKVGTLTKTIHEQECESDNIKRELRKSEAKTDEYLNEFEQYSRINNVRISRLEEKTYSKITPEVKQSNNSTAPEEKISGETKTQENMATHIQDDKSKEANAKDVLPENADQTTDHMINTLNKRLDLNLERKEGYRHVPPPWQEDRQQTETNNSEIHIAFGEGKTYEAQKVTTKTHLRE